MSNTMTALAPILWSVAQKIPRELTGVLGAVTLDFDDKGVALNDSVKVPIVAQGSSSTYTPAMTTTAGSDNTPTTASIVINNSNQYTWNVTGEQERSLLNGGDNAKEFMRQNMEQGVRTLVNAIESRAYVVACTNASRAIGTAGTTPFASAITVGSQTLQIMLDNGLTDVDNLTQVLSTSGGQNLRALVTINGQFPGSTAQDMLTSGILSVIYGIKYRESAQTAISTKGTGTSYTVAASTQTIGATTLTGILAGSGTIVAGDIITFAGDTNKYVVVSSVGGSTVTSITIGAPGLRTAVAASSAITVGANFTPMPLIHRKGIVTVVRPPIIPESPLIQQLPLTDPQTGLSMTFCRIVGDGMTTYRLVVMDGTAAVQTNTTAILLG